MLSSDLEDRFGKGYVARQEAKFATNYEFDREAVYGAASAARLFLAEVARIVSERGESYGPPAEHWARTAALYTALLGSKLKPGATITAREVAELYILDKLSRDASTPKDDNVLDIAGYAAGIATLGEG